MNKIHYYSFNNNNIIYYSSLYLKESKTIVKILKQFFYNINISNPKIQVLWNRIKIRFYYYSEEPEKLKISELEKELSNSFKKKVQIKATPLKYPYMDSQIFVNYLQETETPLKEIQNNIKLFKSSSYTNPVLPGKYLSGIHI